MDNLVAVIGALATFAAAVVPLVISLRSNTQATKDSTAAVAKHTETIAQALAAGVSTVATAVETAETPAAPGS